MASVHVSRPRDLGSLRLNNFGFANHATVEKSAKTTPVIDQYTHALTHVRRTVNLDKRAAAPDTRQECPIELMQQLPTVRGAIVQLFGTWGIGVISGTAADVSAACCCSAVAAIFSSCQNLLLDGLAMSVSRLL